MKMIHLLGFFAGLPMKNIWKNDHLFATSQNVQMVSEMLSCSVLFLPREIRFIGFIGVTVIVAYSNPLPQGYLHGSNGDRQPWLFQ